MARDSPFPAQVRTVLSVLDVPSPAAFTWYGWVVSELVPEVESLIGPAGCRDFLRNAISRHLYQNFYCSGQPVRRTVRTPLARHAHAGEFIDELWAANQGNGFLDPGWHKVDEHDDSARVLVRKGSITLAAEKARLEAHDGALAHDGRSMVALRLPKGILGRSPGFYLACGDTSGRMFDNQEDLHLVRLYWNLEPDGAAPFVRECTTRLNEAGVPFVAKVLTDRQRFERRDSAVLYVAREDLPGAYDALRETLAALARYMRPGTPALTLPLAAGLGLAEDPGAGKSFGMHRCALIAEGAMRGQEHAPGELDRGFDVVAAVFAECGLDIDRPYLGPDHGRGLDIERLTRLGVTGARSWAQPTGADVPQPMAERELLDVAVRMGSTIVDQAVWYESGCTWVGAEPDVTHLGGKAEIATGAQGSYTSLGPEFYHGTSGIAYFLAELYATTRQERFREAALGAVGHSLALVADPQHKYGLGFYTGWPGILAILAHVGTLLEDDNVGRRVTTLLEGMALSSADEDEYDLSGGMAGGIVAFLALDRMLPIDGVRLASKLGERLLRDEVRDGETSSWRSPSFPDRIGLLGLSHGGAGFGLALLELAHVTGDSTYRTVAQRAFNYERRYFVEAEQNWPDFRDKLGNNEWKKDGFLNFMTSWCHGAPGIALSRLRAYALTGDPVCAVEASTALETTATVLENSFEAGNGNFSLCHGWCGNGDVLLAGARALENAPKRYTELAEHVARLGIERYLQADRPLPVGISGGATPTLMLGDAGVGYFYLRLGQRRPASALLPSPEELGRSPWDESERLSP